VVEVPVNLVGIRAGGLLILRCGNEATRGSGGAAHRNGLLITAGHSTKLFHIIASLAGFRVLGFLAASGDVLSINKPPPVYMGGGGDMGGHVLRETTSRGLCGLGCPSRTSERGQGCVRG
jgi:hypothetical protein